MRAYHIYLYTERQHYLKGNISVSLVLIDVVVEELGDEVDVGQYHATAAVSLEAQLIQSLSIYCIIYRDQ